MSKEAIAQWLASFDPYKLGFITGMGSFLIGDAPGGYRFPEIINPTEEAAAKLPVLNEGAAMGYLWASQIFKRLK
ncbi:MAG: hypothetical protein WBE80_10145 [Methylocella sp.]